MNFYTCGLSRVASLEGMFPTPKITNYSQMKINYGKIKSFSPIIK